MQQNIYFICLETKDFIALNPIYKECLELGLSCKIIDYLNNSETFYENLSFFTKDKFPVVVIASPSSLHFISCYRPRWSYLLIGCEHGISLFKNFTYSQALCEYDHYFAPTNLWYERLINLYSNSSTHFHQGDFPRLDELKKQVENYQLCNIVEEIPSSWQNEDFISKRLVILTWGISYEIMKDLPDQVGIVYLLHPAQDLSVSNIHKKHASIIVSSPKVTQGLLAKADIIFGDISSLTLEAAYIRSNVYMIFDRSLYNKKHDLNSDLFDSSSPNYGKIPETNIRIPEKCLLPYDDFIIALKAAQIPEKFTSLHLEKDLLPPSKENEEFSFCARGIQRIIKNYEKIKFTEIDDNPQAAITNFLLQAYFSILKRAPDSTGFENYFHRLNTTTKKPLIAGLEVMLELAQSEEGCFVNQDSLPCWPQLK